MVAEAAAASDLSTATVHRYLRRYWEGGQNPEALWPDPSVREVELAFKLDINEYRGNRSVQLMIQHLWPR